ncbi:unnamed protein product [Leptosia nina]|uniref:Uncharacterized protein n=1 Tax=Leptosia nina TaxID=320188 RepID=A0AAV1J7A6_9NEOP
MFIFVAYKDTPELSTVRFRSSETDLSEEKTLLVNPDCPVRIMLEYIRKKCRLGIFTRFDLCDESGALKGLFNMPTYAYATDQFEHKRTYYLIVLKMEQDKRMSVLPQLNHDNVRYEELKNKVKIYMLGESPIRSPPSGSAPSGKSTPLIKVASKKK